MRYKHAASLCIALLFVGEIATIANATVLFQENFDGYVNQAALEATWTPVGCSGQGACTPPSPLPGGTLSTAQAVSGTQSLFNHSVAGAGLANDASQRNQAQFSATQALAIGDKVVFSFDMYDVLVSPTASPHRQFANLQFGTAPVSSNMLVSIGLNNNLLSSAEGGNYYMARILGGASNGGTASAYFKLNDDGAPLRSNGWHNFKVEISTSNGTTQDYKFFVDNILSETVLGVGAATRQYDTIRVGAGVTSTQDAYYDNFKLEYITASATIEGDYNGNAKVDGADYVIWRKSKGLMGGATVSQGDGTLDGNVLDDDYTYWRDRFGNPTSGSGGSLAASAVPEPASGVLLLISAIATVAGRRHVR